MHRRAVSICVLVLLLVLTSVAWADDGAVECTDFRITGRTTWLEQSPKELKLFRVNRVVARIMADGAVTDGELDEGTFTFSELVRGTVDLTNPYEPVFNAFNQARMEVKPQGDDGNIDLMFWGTSDGIIVEGNWKVARATGSLEDFGGKGTYFGFADYCPDPDDLSSCTGFYVDFFCD